jgi:hypothetical protein
MRTIIAVTAFGIVFFACFALAFAQVPAVSSTQVPPKAAAAIHKAPAVHKAAPPAPKVVYVYPPAPPDWGLGSWIAAPFRAIGSGIGYVGAGVTNVVETPFIAVGQAWDSNNCWRNMTDRRTGETKLYWICK